MLISRPLLLLTILALALPAGAPAGGFSSVRDKAAEVRSSIDQSCDELRQWAKLLRDVRSQGPILKPLLPERTVLSISGRMTPENTRAMIELLSQAGALERLGIDRPTVSRLLEGLQLVGPLLDEVEPEVQVLFARQTFAGMSAVPEAKLPGVALVFRPKHRSRAHQVLLSSYLLAMQQANETARAEGRPPLRMESRRRGDGFYATSSFKLPADAPAELIGLADYNLSPSIAVVRERMFLSSSRELIMELVDLASEASDDLLIDAALRVDIRPRQACHLVLDNVPAILSATGLSAAGIDAGGPELAKSWNRAHARIERQWNRLPRLSAAVVLRPR